MKVYIASSFSLIKKVELVSQKLEDEGYEVLCKWWTGLDYIPWERRTLKEYAQITNPDDFYAHPGCKNAFERDYKGVHEADIFIFVADDSPRKYNGANVEYGVALARRIPCFALGTLENSALYYPIIRCKNVEELLGFLSEGSFRKRKFCEA